MVQKIARSAVVLWVAAFLFAWPFPWTTSHQLRVAYDSVREEVARSDQNAARPPASESSELHDAITAIWTHWVLEMSLIAFGLLASLLLIKGRHRALMFVGTASALFLLVWGLGILMSPYSPIDSLSGFYRSALTFGTAAQRVRVLLHDLVFPILHLCLICAIVASQFHESVRR